jgi:hypothetical protein
MELYIMRQLVTSERKLNIMKYVQKCVNLGSSGYSLEEQRMIT